MSSIVVKNESNIKALNDMPLYTLDAFCDTFKIAVVIEDGKITEIIDN